MMSANGHWLRGKDKDRWRCAFFGCPDKAVWCHYSRFRKPGGELGIAFYAVCAEHRARAIAIDIKQQENQENQENLMKKPTKKPTQAPKTLERGPRLPKGPKNTETPDLRTVMLRVRMTPSELADCHKLAEIEVMPMAIVIRRLVRQALEARTEKAKVVS